MHFIYIFHIISVHGKTWTQQIDLALNVWVEHRTGIAEVTGSYPVEALARIARSMVSANQR